MKNIPVAILLLLASGQAIAWWQGPYGMTPYGYTPWAGSYWPNAWPGYYGGYPGAYPGGYSAPFSYGDSDWNVRGTVNEDGEAHFVIEYHGNIYDDMFDTGYGYGPYRGYPYYGNRW